MSIAAGLLSNAEWDGVKVLFGRLMSTPIRRRRLALDIEKRSGGVKVRHQQLSRVLCTDEAFGLLRGHDLDSLAVLFEVKACLEPEWVSGENCRRVAEAAFAYMLEAGPRSVAMGLQALEDIRDVRAAVDRVLQREHRVPAFGPDPKVWELRADELLDRDDDLDSLGWMMRHGAGGYEAIRAVPWSGKTSVMCELAVGPPSDVDVVSFFVRSVGGRNTANDFLEVVNRQLRALTRLGVEPGEDFARRRANFEELWRAASANAADSGRNLCLLLDGLDEQSGEETPISRLDARASAQRNSAVL